MRLRHVPPCCNSSREEKAIALADFFSSSIVGQVSEIFNLYLEIFTWNVFVVSFCSFGRSVSSSYLKQKDGAGSSCMPWKREQLIGIIVPYFYNDLSITNVRVTPSKVKKNIWQDFSDIFALKELNVRKDSVAQIQGQKHSFGAPRPTVPTPHQ